ncbi:GGDEF domain-containing response regulator [Halanaerobacter jeridensis]|uniref:Stage 0 sporulation protein A homolog n=1 Tax=Halanaerobacter jeridensis TaxID=706427 RepID=A0A938XNI2_9FIRM|nr:diguanylate cyclase [Halanaerobacter jeridensis]MBM7555778.1 diguanylate cyclase (GGDEF)-like protein [Halanaerobacter jeridensis]
MKILIVDDASDIRRLLGHIIRKSGYEDLEFAVNGQEALNIIEQKQNSGEKIDLILLDIMLPDINGIEVCRQLKSKKIVEGVPIIMVTGEEDETVLEQAFSAGAMDYIVKPFSQIELKARVKSALELRQERQKRSQREAELEDATKSLKTANKELERLASLDGLTKLANRRLFDQKLQEEWGRSVRKDEVLGLIMLDIDYFKEYNDTYGHQAGDKCLQDLASKLEKSLFRSGDFVARYGGEEFAAILPETDYKGLTEVAERIRREIQGLKIKHENSEVSDYVTVSLGAAVACPESKSGIDKLVQAADKELYRAKENGRNQVKIKKKLVTGEEEG